MTGTSLRDALHEVAAHGVGTDIEVRVARVGAAARVSGRRTARRRVLVGGAVATTAVLVAAVVVGLLTLTRPPEVVPASGPGSLPDQIFPTRQHILTMEQAPIGRVSLVYGGLQVNGGNAAVAVGADADEYRWVSNRMSASTPTDVSTVQISPDGTQISLSRSGDTARAFGVEVVDAATGAVTTVLDRTHAPLGGDVQAVQWSPSGSRLAVEVSVVVKRLSETGRRLEEQLFVVSQLGQGSVAEVARQEAFASDFSQDLVGWRDDLPVVLSREEPSSRAFPPGAQAVLLALSSAETRFVGHTDATKSWITSPALSPDGSRFAMLDDPTPSSSGDGEPWRMLVVDTSTGDVVREVSGIPEDMVALIGWRDEKTPVLYQRKVREGTGGALQMGIFAYPSGGEAEMLVDLTLSDPYQGWVSSAVVAQDVLASGTVRDAQPPEQPWYDLRTLGPATGEWVVGHKMLVALIVVTLVGAIVVLARRRAV